MRHQLIASDADARQKQVERARQPSSQTSLLSAEG
jgi:hypothetical protein